MTSEITKGTETETTQPRGKAAEATEKVVESAIDLGRVWARYGLSIGKMALETSATSLKTTAGLLGTIAEAFEKPAREAGSAEPESAPSA